MEVEVKVVTEVADGWVVFQDKHDPADTFRRSTEVHLLTMGRKPVVGDVYRFRAMRNLDTSKYYYYAQDGGS